MTTSLAWHGQDSARSGFAAGIRRTRFNVQRFLFQGWKKNFFSTLEAETLSV